VDRPDEWTLACALDRLTAQGIVCASFEGVDLILIWSDGRAVACERACPHDQADLEDGSISQGWASRPLRIYPVRVEHGQVWVKVARPA
jgi:3-phenylpropionate/trans-cinnamate dioxygenase ferredoxin subunit